jgi:hypothetical protein
MPTRMNGVDAGTTTLAKMTRSEAPSTRAALIRVLSTSTTPWKEATTQAMNEAIQITAIFGTSPIPRSTTASGISASGGMVRKNWMYGSTTARTTGYQPMRKPTGTATTTPRA